MFTNQIKIKIMDEIERILDKVLDNGGRMDVSDMGLAWTWYDDDGEDCGTSQVESLSVGEDCNGVQVVFVEFNDRTEVLDNLDYQDVLGYNFVEYLYDEL
jgi:hypothetical protein